MGAVAQQSPWRRSKKRLLWIFRKVNCDAEVLKSLQE